MKWLKKDKLFVTPCLLSFLLFALLLAASMGFNLYEVIPVFGFFGYGLIILNILWALNCAWNPWHYIVVSLLLILFGTIGSLDILLSKEEMLINLRQAYGDRLGLSALSEETLDDYVNVVIILLNVFTSALAGNALFYGLNKRNFQNRD